MQILKVYCAPEAPSAGSILALKVNLSHPLGPLPKWELRYEAGTVSAIAR
jgi:hypothetical protein